MTWSLRAERAQRGATCLPFFLDLPGLSWIQVQATAVKIDRHLDVLPVPVAADSTFDRHDPAVHRFGNRIGDPVRAVADYVGQSVPDRLGKLLH